ncbi:MAG: hypothetical protein Q9162_006006 [Coniocarpon cinnabarinum]
MFTGFVQPAPAMHETSFFIDSDADEDTASDTGESFDYETDASPVESSVESLSGRSQITTSPADLLTPNSQAEDASPNLIFRLKSVKGRDDPRDGHLFRATLASTQDFDWQTYEPDLVKVGQPPVPAIPAHFKHDQVQESAQELVAQSLPAPNQSESDILGALQGSAVDITHHDDGSDVAMWTTQQVAAWMYTTGFENSIIITFKTHDINGSILLDLGFEDLRELDIASFAKRRQIWNEINTLRDEGSRDPLTAHRSNRDRGCSYVHLFSNTTERVRRPAFERNRSSTITGYRRPNRLTLEQSRAFPHQTHQVPRPHRCSKGERCPKWKQQQRILGEIDDEHGPDTPRSGRFDFSSPLISPRFSRRTSLATTLSTVMFAPLSDDNASTHNREQDPTQATEDQSIPPVPPLPAAVPAADCPTLKPATHSPDPSDADTPVSQPAIDTPHIVQQYTDSSNSATTPTPNTPQWDIFPAPYEDRPSHPPRQSSLPGPLPKLSIPSSPVHGPASGETTIRDKQPDATVHTNPDEPENPYLNATTPELVPVPLLSARSPDLFPPPLSSSSSSRAQSPSPNLSVAVRRPSPDPSLIVHPLRSPSSEPTIPSTFPSVPFRQIPQQPAFCGPPSRRDIPTAVPPTHFRKDSSDTSFTGLPTRPGALRAAASSDALPLRRQVKPLPTLKESSLASHKTKPSFSSKPLPETPSLFLSPQRNQSATAIPAVNRDVARSTSQNPHNGPSHGSRSVSPLNVDIIKPPPMPSSAPIAYTPRTPKTPRYSTTPTTPAIPSTPRDASPSLSPSAYGPDILQVGWVRYRRARLWRHEWAPVHLRLTKTQVSLHPSARPDSKPFEVVKMNEYELAMSQESNPNRISSALTRWRGGGSRYGTSGGSLDDTFTFQIVPTQETTDAFQCVRHPARRPSQGENLVERDWNQLPEGKSSSAGSKDEMNARMLKTYHFAVKTRDERIEWMRQLMMARETIAKTDRERRQREEIARTGTDATRPVTREGRAVDHRKSMARHGSF